MFKIVEKELQLEFPQGHHLHSMICQLPNRLTWQGSVCQLVDPEAKWRQVRSTLDLVAEGRGNLRKLNFLIFPEACLPARAVSDTLKLIGNRFPTNTVTIFGLEHIPLSSYRDLLESFAADNAEALSTVTEDLASAEIDTIPVNSAVTAVKEADGRLRVFFQAKGHPCFGEETIDPFHDLYRGKVLPLFRCVPNGFNFMSLICLDYVYRDLYQSNISTIIDHANSLFHQTRQRLDLLCVIQCNPKPEHPAFRDVINGFYGEYLAYTPGVRDTVTLFCNSSNQTTGFPDDQDFAFGHSMVIMHKNHKMAEGKTSEFLTDTFADLPVCRLRFGAETRLYFFNLPLFHELDPRTTRFPLKVHAIFEPKDSSWERLSGLSADLTTTDHDYAAARQLDAANSTERTQQTND
jgi:hypothetical protein